MQPMLDELSQAVAPAAHAVVLMDRAGWHIARERAIPANLTPIFLPAYSPELNAVERVWLYLRERFLSHLLWPRYDDIPRCLLRRLGTPSSTKPAASAPFAPSLGQRSVLNAVGISRTSPVISIPPTGRLRTRRRNVSGCTSGRNLANFPVSL
jgi:hypothetical protein